MHRPIFDRKNRPQAQVSELKAFRCMIFQTLTQASQDSETDEGRADASGKLNGREQKTKASRIVNLPASMPLPRL